MELNKPPCVKNVLIITNHSTRYALAVVTKDQTTKIIMKVLYERFIVVFGAPAKILSDHGANFTSTLVEELCAAFGIQKCRTTAYHAQCNGQVECFHQMLFHMIGKLMSDKKSHWQQHLLELVQAYNSTRLAITGYSPRYLMFGRHLCLPIDLLFSDNGCLCACLPCAHVCCGSENVLRRPIQTHGPTARLNGKNNITTGLLALCSSHRVT